MDQIPTLSGWYPLVAGLQEYRAPFHLPSIQNGNKRWVSPCQSPFQKSSIDPCWSFWQLWGRPKAEFQRIHNEQRFCLSPEPIGSCLFWPCLWTFSATMVDRKMPCYSAQAIQSIRLTAHLFLVPLVCKVHICFTARAGGAFRAAKRATVTRFAMFGTVGLILQFCLASAIRAWDLNLCCEDAIEGV